jgi:hypothetical protein
MPVQSPVNVHNLQFELLKHPDYQFVDYLVNGFKFGFDTKVQFPKTGLLTKECKNLMSARRNETVVDNLLQTEVQKGFMAGPFTVLPFKNYRVSPLGVAQGKYSKKYRLIVDLSAPHDDCDHSSINSLIDKEECSLSYVSIDDAIRRIIYCGPGSSLCKTDISDAFKLIPIKPEQYHLFCVKWRDHYFYCNRLAFGCRSSPVIFDTFSQAICWIASNNYGIEYILHMLDDFLTIDSPKVNAQATMQALLQLFEHLNVPLSEHKTIGPSTMVEYLGIILDTVAMQARLPMDKVDRITTLLKTFQGRKSCTKRELLQLLGHLNFAFRVILPGRSFVSYLLKLAASAKKLHHYVHLDYCCQEDIKMWLTFLEQWNGVSLFHQSQITNAHDMELFTDASSTIGFGGYYQGHWFSDTWPSDLPCSNDTEISMAFRELYPIVVAAILWGSSWSTKRIMFYCDNMSTVQIIRKGRSKIINIMQLMRRLTWLAAQYNFTVYCEHVPGINNVIADSLSRFQWDRFRQLAPMADLEPHVCPALSQVLWSSEKGPDN